MAFRTDEQTFLQLGNAVVERKTLSTCHPITKVALRHVPPINTNEAPLERGKMSNIIAKQ
jgi:hypothetical protein